MPHVVHRYRNVLVATVLAGLGVAGGSLLGPARPTPVIAAASVPRWLAEPLAPPDPRTGTPERVAGFFRRITPAGAAELTRRYPEIVGNLDGAPATLRFAANRARFAANRARFAQSAGRQILAFDDRGDGRVAEVLGDLNTADRTVVLVPGVDGTLAGFDTGHGGVQRRAPAWQARQLFEQIRAERPGAGVAVIAWLGYDPPEGVRGAALRADRAAGGALALDRFVDALVLGRPGRSVVVLGHSYGSTVAGLAAPRLSPQVSDIVSIGSPGMGVSGRAALRTTAQVWDCTAPDDWIRRVPGVRVLGVGHGTLPSDPDFGAVPLACGDADGHDGYFVSGTSALRALATVSLGRAGGDPR